ncbi:peptide-binding protein [Paraburkholderia sp. J76]|uniref:peptide-binding protein n=1 Tax=Paraburkholderia sp. J76 TaxID=2805439 RepID=UPI002ABDE1D6|nr:peptide-binding protein [Paraburkholderia sp. J76]
MLAHAQPGFPGHGGGGGFAQAMHPAPRAGMSWGGGYHGAPERGEGRAAMPMRVADRGGRYERAGNPAPNQWQGRVQQQAPRRDYSYGTPFSGGYGGYRGNPITPVSAETRQVPHPPADSPVRAGSIREDVARYNEERGGTFRPFPRNGGEVPRPPMPSPYRN